MGKYKYETNLEKFEEGICEGMKYCIHELEYLLSDHSKKELKEKPSFSNIFSTLDWRKDMVEDLANACKNFPTKKGEYHEYKEEFYQILKDFAGNLYPILENYFAIREEQKATNKFHRTFSNILDKYFERKLK